MNSFYPGLFSPITLCKGVIAKNRIESAPMGAYGTVPFYTREAFEMYGNMAKGGAGIVTLGEAGVDWRSDTCHPTMPHLDDTTTLASLIQTVDCVKKYGALASIELNHSGNRSNPKFLADGGRLIGPSKMINLYGAEVEEMDEEMMDYTADKFAEAAYMAKFAGMDLVNLHFGHGWLISQFLSNLDNHRTDKYGGSIENKARFPLMILDRIKKRCGANFPVEVRISAEEIVKGGMTIDETVEFAKMLDGKADIIHVSMATFHAPETVTRMMPSTFLERGCNLDFVKQIKAVVKKSLVSSVGAYSDPEQMENIIQNKEADIIVVGRQFIADPEFPNKCKNGKADEIRRCIRCNECISAGFIPHVPFASGVLRCSVNPVAGREYETTRKVEQAKFSRKVLIAGAGPAGLEAAIEAGKKGHRVILCEKTDETGYNLRYSKVVDFKKDIYVMLQHMTNEIKRNENIEIRFNTVVDEKLIEKENPSVLIAAVGANPIKLPVPVEEGRDIYHICDLYKKEITLGEKVVIIGGGLVGSEEAIYLAEKGKKVTLIEQKPDIAKDASYIHWLAVKQKIKDVVEIHTETKCKSVTKAGVIAEDKDGNEILFEADTVLYAIGMRDSQDLVEKWRDMVPEIINVGDSLRPRKIQEAIRTGYCAGSIV